MRRHYWRTGIIHKAYNLCGLSTVDKPRLSSKWLTSFFAIIILTSMDEVMGQCDGSAGFIFTQKAAQHAGAIVQNPRAAGD
jgi:hypothetical protein